MGCTPSASSSAPTVPPDPVDSVPPSDAVQEQLDLAYSPPDGVDDGLATLDLYRVDDGQQRPLVLLVHGGSWVSGDKSNFGSTAPDFIPWWIERGYVVAAVNFRLASPLGQALEVGPRDQARDIAYALAWLNEQGEERGIAPEGTVAVGYSSGAHLVALLGADGSYLEETGLPETHLAATVSLDVHAYDVPYALDLMVGSQVEQNIPLIEHLFGETTTDQLSASPIQFTQGWVAPALIVSVEPSPDEVGTHGFVVNKAAENYAAALQAGGHTVTTLHDSDETHASLAMGFGADDDLVTETVGAFLEDL